MKIIATDYDGTLRMGDRISEDNIKAIEKFDASFEVQFSTYAVPMIMGEIKRFLRDRNGIKVPRSMRDTAYKALRAREILCERNPQAELVEIVNEEEAKNEPVKKTGFFDRLFGRK